MHDSNCLLAWGPEALVVAFRGTDSLANVKADLKVGWCLAGLSSLAWRRLNQTGLGIQSWAARRGSPPACCRTRGL